MRQVNFSPIWHRLGVKKLASQYFLKCTTGYHILQSSNLLVVDMFNLYNLCFGLIGHGTIRTNLAGIWLQLAK